MFLFFGWKKRGNVWEKRKRRRKEIGRKTILGFGLVVIGNHFLFPHYYINSYLIDKKRNVNTNLISFIIPKERRLRQEERILFLKKPSKQRDGAYLSRVKLFA